MIGDISYEFDGDRCIAHYTISLEELEAILSISGEDREHYLNRIKDKISFDINEKFVKDFGQRYSGSCD